MIEAQHLSKAYGGGAYALRGLSLVIDKGEFVFLTGPSGAGKSTLLRLLLCQERPSEGRLTVDGADLSLMGAGETQANRRHVGFVFQDFKLIERMTVLENTAFVPRVMGAAPTVQRRKAERVLKWVGLERHLDAYPSQLSGGEQQRVAIARALINDPKVVLADEPTGNLDPDLALEIMNLFREINARGTTVVVATHDRELIRQVGRRAILLEHGVITEESPAIGDRGYFAMEDWDQTEAAPAPVQTPADDGESAGVSGASDEVPVSATGSASLVDTMDTMGAMDAMTRAEGEADQVSGASDGAPVTRTGFAGIDDAMTLSEVEAEVSGASDDARVTPTDFAGIDDALARADGEAHKDETG